MFSNLSERWRRRLRIAVVVWAVLLVAVAFAGSRATVREQVDAAGARELLDAAVGEAAAVFTGAAVLAVGPLTWEACDVTPVRQGLSLERTLQVSGATVEHVEALAARFALRSLTSDPDGASWSGTTQDFIGVRVNAPAADPPGDRWAEPVAVQAISGCRPLEAPLGSFTPEPPAEATDAWDYGSIDCPGGETLTSWTEQVDAQPMRVHETTGGCT
ncbi:hypothetical protein [Glycomyces tritici]|uniref:Flp pilus-assembly TadG-like N-terminal domain-containing protein n=1 Tax=Glycomyces tritici TaxID=2665176 RepID=A0ABT7YZQ8_9ACTN|nr:hypothetical protein [Glycomyces tritici]MDN3243370.1 hypothetical protein [Glycomyces tritici]MDN3243753.1 hypothetical protein [Glycomyces tritici]